MPIMPIGLIAVSDAILKIILASKSYELKTLMLGERN